MKMIHDCCILQAFLSEHGGEVTSRDLGRYLQRIQVEDSDVLSLLKDTSGGLRRFLQADLSTLCTFTVLRQTKLPTSFAPDVSECTTVLCKFV
eukprot:6205299-Pleurochrysis_carterae.AAC.2